MDRRTFLATTAGLGTFSGLAGCMDGSASQPADYDIGMSIRKFQPAAIEVSPGTTVVWKNTSSHTHTVTAYEDRIPDSAEFFASGGFGSEQEAVDAWGERGGGGIQPNGTFEREFTVPGRHAYFCIPHEVSGMVGTIVVTENPSTEK